MKNKPKKEPMVEEAVGVFDSHDALQAAADELLQQGFMQQELSVLADEKTLRAKLGGRTYKDVRDAEDDPAAPRASIIEDEVIGEAKASIIGVFFYVAAALAVAIAAAMNTSTGWAVLTAVISGSCGAGLGYMAANVLGRKREKYIRAQAERGGFALWVHLRSPGQVGKAWNILQKHNARDVHMHKIPLYA